MGYIWDIMWDIWDLCGIYMIPVLGSLAPLQWYGPPAGKVPPVVWPPLPHHGGGEGVVPGYHANGWRPHHMTMGGGVGLEPGTYMESS